LCFNSSNFSLPLLLVSSYIHTPFSLTHTHLHTHTLAHTLLSHIHTCTHTRHSLTYTRTPHVHRSRPSGAACLWRATRWRRGLWTPSRAMTWTTPTTRRFTTGTYPHSCIYSYKGHVYSLHELMFLCLIYYTIRGVPSRWKRVWNYMKGGRGAGSGGDGGNGGYVTTTPSIHDGRGSESYTSSAYYRNENGSDPLETYVTSK
jgi:hypothetical protein